MLGVYNFTGAADDDGFLSSSQAQAALALTNSAIAYSNMYTIRVRNAANYSIPRQIRIGLLFTFYYRDTFFIIPIRILATQLLYPIVFYRM